MSFKCERHKLRKRYSTCPDCKKELEESVTEVLESAAQEDIVEANISPSETISVEEQVVSQIDDIKLNTEEISKSEAIVSSKYLNNIQTELINAINVNNERVTVEEYFNKKLKQLEEQVGHICNISYEHLAISLASFNKKVIGELEDDGWRVLNMITGSLAVNSGFDEDTVLFQRVKTKFRKYTQDETYKKCIKEKEG